MTESEDRIACWAVGVRSRDELRHLAEVADKLVLLTAPGEHDPEIVAARSKELGKVVEEIRRNAADSVACGVPAPQFDERGDLVQLAPGGKVLPRSWVRDWQIYGEKLLRTADAHARAVALSSEVHNVVNEMVWSTRDVQRPGGSAPQGEVTLRMGPKGNYLFTPQTEEDLETARDLEKLFSGQAEQRHGVDFAPRPDIDTDLQPSLADALGHLRSVLSAVTAESPTHILINWGGRGHGLEVAGYTNPYRGETWGVKITPAYVLQNQREIAEYVRRNEDAIVEEVRRLLPRKQRRAGWHVNFYETHPGLDSAPYVKVGPPQYNDPYSYQLPDYHLEDH